MNIQQDLREAMSVFRGVAGGPNSTDFDPDGTGAGNIDQLGENDDDGPGGL